MNIFGAIGHVLATTFLVVVNTFLPSSHHVTAPTKKPVPIQQQQIFSEKMDVSSPSATVTNTPPAPQKTKTVTPTKTQIEEPPIIAKSTITIADKTVYLTMTYPSTGGMISGNIGGDCSGSVNGQYDGPSTEVIIGTAKGSCLFGLVAIPVTVRFNGLMDPNDTRVNIHYTVSAMDTVEAGTTTLVLSR